MVLCTYAFADVATCVWYVLCVFVCSRFCRATIDALHFQIDLLDFTASFWALSLSLSVFSFASSSLSIYWRASHEMNSEHRHEIMYGAAFEKRVPYVLSLSLSPSKMWKLLRFFILLLRFRWNGGNEFVWVRLCVFYTRKTSIHTTKNSGEKKQTDGIYDDLVFWNTDSHADSMECMARGSLCGKPFRA